MAARNGLELRSLRKSMATSVFGCPHLPRAALIETLLQTAPFAGRRPVILSGSPADDTAFVCADAHGGFGIRIGRIPLHTPHGLRNARAARALLGEWATHQHDWPHQASA